MPMFTTVEHIVKTLKMQDNKTVKNVCETIMPVLVCHEGMHRLGTNRRERKTFTWKMSVKQFACGLGLWKGIWIVKYHLSSLRSCPLRHCGYWLAHVNLQDVVKMLFALAYAGFSTGAGVQTSTSLPGSFWSSLQ